MLPPLFTISLQIALALAVAITGSVAFVRQPQNRIHRVFAIYNGLFALAFLFDGANRLAFYEGISFTDRLFRLADVCLLFGAALLAYFSVVYPRRAGTGRERPLQRRSRTWFILIGMGSTAIVLTVLSFTRWHMTGRSFDPITGAFASDPGPVYLINRLFLLLALVLSIFEQLRFVRYHPRDPRRLHALYFVYATGTMGVAYVLLNLPRLWTAQEDLLIALQAALLFAHVSFLHNLLMNIGLSYRASVLRNGILLAGYGVLLAPVIYLLNAVLVRSTDYGSWSVAIALCALFVGFHYLGGRLTPYLERLLFQKRRNSESAAASFNQKILQLGSGDPGVLRRQLASFLEAEYEPQYLALYFRSEDGSELLRDRTLTRIADYDSIPPETFPELLLPFLSGAGNAGGLIADLLARAERSNRRNASQALMSFAACGAEILMALIDHTAGDTVPEGVISIGLTRNGRPFDGSDVATLRLLQGPTILAIKNQELFRSTSVLKERLEEENRRMTRRLAQNLEELTRSSGRAAAFIYKPEGTMARVLLEVERFAEQSGPVLITGETGAGKGEIARMIHGLSARDGDFVTVNCSAIPDDLIENELFGHEKGAYTGATEARDGLVQRADKGTLFLDEIGEMPLQGQAKLLRLLQEGEYERIGSADTRRTSARFLFATNRDLEADVDANRFRTDLFYRISTFEVLVPPLRERPDDIPLLIDHFLWTAGQKLGRPGLTFNREAMEMLLSYNWPGNIRELENLIMRTVVLSETDDLGVEQLPVMFRDHLDFDRKKKQLERVVEDQARLERELVLEAMEKSRGNQREAAKLLNISRGALQYRLRQYGVSR